MSGTVYTSDLEEIRKHTYCGPILHQVLLFPVFSHLIFIINLLWVNFHKKRGKEQRKVQYTNDAFKLSEG